MGSHAKTGKSWMALEIARSIALGEVPFKCPHFEVPEPAVVLYVEQELKEYGLQVRVKEMFDPSVFPPADKERLRGKFWYESGNPEINFSTPEGKKIVYDLVKAHRPAVLFLDPMGKLHTFDENSNTEVNKLMTELDRLIVFGREWGMSIVYIHHFGKPPKGMDREGFDELDPYNFRGASKWFDDADTIQTAARKANVKGRLDSWLINTRFITRNRSGFPDMQLCFNRKLDRRVLWERDLDSDQASPPPMPPGLDVPAEAPRKERGFLGAPPELRYKRY